MPVRDPSKTWEFIFKNQQVNKQKENSECFWTCSIVSVERTPSSVISVSDDLRMEVIVEKLFFSSFGESIKFQSSNSDATISFSCISKQVFQFKCKGKINNDEFICITFKIRAFLSIFNLTMACSRPSNVLLLIFVDCSMLVPCKLGCTSPTVCPKSKPSTPHREWTSFTDSKTLWRRSDCREKWVCS